MMFDFNFDSTDYLENIRSYRRSAYRTRVNCSAWSGHAMTPNKDKSGIYCLRCGHVASLVDTEGFDTPCYNFYGHKIQSLKNSKRELIIYCSCCSDTRLV